MRPVSPLFLALSLLPQALSVQEAAVAGPVIFSAGAVFPIPEADISTPPDLGSLNGSRHFPVVHPGCHRSEAALETCGY